MNGRKTAKPVMSIASDSALNVALNSEKDGAHRENIFITGSYYYSLFWSIEEIQRRKNHLNHKVVLAAKVNIQF